MKIALPIIVIILACGSPIPDKTEKELLEILIERALPAGPQGKAVYVSAEPLPGGSIIHSWTSDYVAPIGFKYSWFYFVDDHPEANWEHASRYIFIDTETGEYQVKEGKTPPNTIGVMIKLYPSN